MHIIFLNSFIIIGMLCLVNIIIIFFFFVAGYFNSKFLRGRGAGIRHPRLSRARILVPRILYMVSVPATGRGSAEDRRAAAKSARISPKNHEKKSKIRKWRINNCEFSNFDQLVRKCSSTLFFCATMLWNRFTELEERNKTRFETS